MFNPELDSREPEEIQPINLESDVPKEKLKNKQGISRRDFLKKTGAALVGAAIVAEKAELKGGDEKWAKEEEKRRRENYLALKEIFSHPEKIKKLQSQVDYLVAEFSKDAGFLPKAVFNLESIPSLIAKIEKAIEAGEGNIFVNPVGDFTLGEELSMYSEGWQEFSREQKKEMCSEIEFEGFSNEKQAQIKKALEEKYPLQWLGGTVGKIIFDKDMGDVAGKHSSNPLTSNPALSAALGRKNEKSTIKIVSSAEDLPKILDIANHELAHGNDWNSCLLLSMPQRIEFFCDATQAFKNTKKFHSEYVPPYNPDEEKNYKNLKVIEYWAEATRRYMEKGSENYQKTNPTEYALVKKWYNIINDIKE